MATALANEAAALAAGYKAIKTDRGATFNPRFLSVLEKPVDNDLASSSLFQVQGESNASQAAADADALAKLNATRDLRWGTQAAGGNKGPRSGAAKTVDSN